MPRIKESETQTEREFIEYRFDQIDKRLDSTDSKLDHMQQTMNGFAFAKQTALDGLANEMREKYVKKESFTWVRTLAVTVAGAVATAIAFGILNLLGDRL